MKSTVFQIFPSVFTDNRGSFSEIWKNSNQTNPFSDFSWVKQVNRSKSIGNTIRGCHAQRGRFCQAKMVQAVNARLYDVIIDARTDSGTFGRGKIYLLDPDVQNMLWVPRGFLHAFIVPNMSDIAIFEYYCDNVYDKPSEIGCNPMSIVPKLMNDYICDFPEFKDMLNSLDAGNVNLSDKDSTNPDCDLLLSNLMTEYLSSNFIWYK